MLFCAYCKLFYFLSDDTTQYVAEECPALLKSILNQDKEINRLVHSELSSSKRI